MEATKQKMKLTKETGSFFNYLMGNNSTVPEVGKGATVLHWTDRSAYEVIEVSKDKKRVVVQQYQPERIDNHGMSECQSYKYEKLNPCKETIVWKWGSWKWERVHIELEKAVEDQVREAIRQEWKTDKRDVYNKYFDEHGDLRLIEGETKKCLTYPKVNILWGEKREYYDYSF